MRNIWIYADCRWCPNGIKAFKTGKLADIWFHYATGLKKCSNGKTEATPV